MFKTNNQNFITLYNVNYYDKEAGVFYITPKTEPKVFKTEKELIEFLANHVETFGYMDSEKWYCEFFKRQNLTGTDQSFFDFGQGFYFLNNYLFLDSYQRVIDVRYYKEDVYNLVYARLSNLVESKSKYLRTRRFQNYKRRQHHTSHSCTLYRSDVRYFRTLRLAMIPEYQEYIPPKDKELFSAWRDDFWTRGECGWKSQTKFRHQWERNANRKK